MANNEINYCTYTLDDIAEMSNCWIIFSEHMSTGPFDSAQEAKDSNDAYIEWEDVEYITIEDFKERLKSNPELELEPF